MNMKKSIIFLALASFVLAACDDLLSLSPESQLTAAAYFKTEEDLQLFSNTFYNNLLDKECFAEESDVMVTRNPSALIRGGNDRTIPQTGGSWSWSNLRKMNTLLANIDNCKSEAAVTKYTALVKFWRAFFYADKVAKFGDVPWIDHEIGSADPDLYNPRDSRETVLQHMIEDIDYAIANLPEKYPSPETAYRVNKYTAMFLKAQFCLFEGTFRKYHAEPAPFPDSYTAADGTTHDADWYLDQAIDAAGKLIASGKYKLFTTGKTAQDYLTLFNQNDANTDEYILAINFDQSLKIKHDLGRFYTNQTASRPGMTKKLVDQYLMKDGTRFTDKPGWDVMTFADEVKDRDPRLAQTIRTPGYSWGTTNCGPELQYCHTGYQIIKYVPAYDTKPYSTDNCFNDLPVYRYAEALLNYAEAKAERGTLTQADLDLSVNLLRKRVGMPDLDMAAANASPDPYLMSGTTGYPNVGGSNKGVILEIRRERAIELFVEGWGRFFDLMRWKAGYAINQPMYGMYIPGPGDYDFGDKSKYTFYTDDTNSALTRIKIGEDVFFADPSTGADATKGCIDVMRTIGHAFDETKHYFFPIPSKEIELNGKLVQNPNWK